MLDSARTLAVEHLEHEVGLAPRTFAAKKSQFPTVDRILNQYSAERAFWITGIAREAILKEARNYILNYAKEHPEQLVPDAGFEEGLYETLKEWLPVKDAAGRMVNIASRSEVIARTNIMDMYNYARLAQMQAPELKNWVKAYRYSAILDAVTTPICRQRHGKIFTPETLNGWAPPAHFQCRSVLLPVTLLDRGWQDEMAKQGPVTIPSQAGFATPGSAADIAATGRAT